MELNKLTNKVISWVILLFCFVITDNLNAATHNIAATRAAFNAQHDSAEDGDTIIFAAGTVTSGTIMPVTKRITILGAAWDGGSGTTIQGRGFSVALSTTDGRVEIGHFTATGPTSDQQGFIEFPDTGDILEDQIVIHDIHGSGGYWAVIYGIVEGFHGVVYDCTFTGNEHHAYFGYYPDDTIPNHSSPPWDYDEAHYAVFEDCTFGPTSEDQILFVTEHAYNYWVRHSAITMDNDFPQFADMHGGIGSTEMGVIISDCTFDFANDGEAVSIRGGSRALCYNNTKTGSGDVSIGIDASCGSDCDPTFDMYVWDNTGLVINASGNTLGVNYFTTEEPSAKLAYPHPLRTSESSTDELPNYLIIPIDN